MPCLWLLCVFLFKCSCLASDFPPAVERFATGYDLSDNRIKELRNEFGESYEPKFRIKFHCKGVGETYYVGYSLGTYGNKFMSLDELVRINKEGIIERKFTDVATGNEGYYTSISPTVATLFLSSDRGENGNAVILMTVGEEPQVIWEYQSPGDGIGWYSDCYLMDSEIQGVKLVYVERTVRNFKLKNMIRESIIFRFDSKLLRFFLDKTAGKPQFDECHNRINSTKNRDAALHITQFGQPYEGD